MESNDLEELRLYISAGEGRDHLSALKLRYYRQRLEAGGGFGDSESNRGVFSDLADRAGRGENITDEIDDRFRDGSLSKSDRSTLTKLADDKRFGEAEDYLKAALKVGEGAVGNVFTQRAKGAEATREFLEWKLLT